MFLQASFKNLFQALSTGINATDVQAMEREGRLEEVWQSLQESMDTESIWLIIVLVNERIREGVDVVSFLTKDPMLFMIFFGHVIAMIHHNSFWLPHLRVQYVVFLVNLYQFMDHVVIRAAFADKLLSLALWKLVSRGRLNKELKTHIGLEKHWNCLMSTSTSTQPPVVGDRSALSSSSTDKVAKKSGKRKATASSDSSHEHPSGTPLTEQWIPTLIESYFVCFAGLSRDCDGDDMENNFHFLFKLICCQ